MVAINYESMEELEVHILDHGKNDRTTLMHAITLQFKECFRRFCYLYNLSDEWAFFQHALTCIGGPEAARKDAADKVELLFQEYNDELQGHDAFQALALLGCSLIDTLIAFQEAVASYFHIIGACNLTLSDVDLDWIDPSYPPHPTLKKWITPYLNFIDKKISSEKLLSQAELYSFYDLNAAVYPD